MSRRSVTSWRITGVIAMLLGIVFLGTAVYNLTAVEQKAYERRVDESYSSTKTIWISLVLVFMGLALLVLAGFSLRKSSRYSRSLAGTALLWQRPFVEKGELPFSAPVPPEAPKPDAANSPLAPGGMTDADTLPEQRE